MFKLDLKGEELHKYHTRIQRMRKFTTLFMRGWILGIFLCYIYFVFIDKRSIEYGLTYASIMTIVGYICTYSGYFLVRFLVWKEYKKKNK